MTWSSQGAKYREGEIEQKWRSFKPGAGNGVAAIASLAREAGADLAAIGRKHAAAAGARSSQFDLQKWFATLDLSAVDVFDDEDDDQGDEPSGLGEGDFEEGSSSSAQGAEAEGRNEQSGAASDPLERRVSDLRSKMMKASEAKPFLASRYLVKGWLDRTSLSVVFGPSNVGKSFFVLDLANHVASGNSWNGRLVRPGTVFYVVAEGARSFQNRLAALADGASENLHIIFTALDLCMDVSDAMALGRLLQEGAATWGPPALVVIDTLARSLGGGDENSGPDMGRLIDHLGVLQEMTGAHVLLVHHTGKDTERGARGHSSLRAAVDTEIEISRSGDESVVKTKKQRDLEGGGRLAFTLETVVLGTDDDGDEVTSCCVRYAATSSAKPSGNTLGSLQKEVLRRAGRLPEGAWLRGRPGSGHRRGQSRQRRRLQGVRRGPEEWRNKGSQPRGQGCGRQPAEAGPHQAGRGVHLAPGLNVRTVRNRRFSYRTYLGAGSRSVRTVRPPYGGRTCPYRRAVRGLGCHEVGRRARPVPPWRGPDICTVSQP